MLPELKLAVLVSIGLHPESGRSRRAEQDARAVELSLNLSDDVQLIHAGEGDEQVLRRYLGMGLKRMTLLEADNGVDIEPVLRDYLNSHPFDIVLTGTRTETGEASGMVPCLLAERLGWPLVSNIVAIEGEVSDGKIRVLQALPRGQRRALVVPLPFVASVDMAAPEPRQSAFGPGQRACIDVIPRTGIPAVASAAAESGQWQQSPARPRPKRLKIVKAKTAADRFKAATVKAKQEGGIVLQQETASEKAQAILDLLIEEKVLR